MAQSTIGRKYGWIPSLPDYRDEEFAYKTIRPAVVPSLPPVVDNLQYLPPVRDQGNEGSCTGFGTTGALHFIEMVKWGKMLPLSPQFAYFIGRDYEGNADSDSGAMIRDVMKMLAKYGVPLETQYPYQAGQYALRPSSLIYQEASLHKIISFHAVYTIDEIRENLAAKHPVVGGISVYSGFESSQVARDGMVWIPKRGESFMGGHCTWYYGYNDNTERLDSQNSWNKTWGDKGSFHIPYPYIKNPRLAQDFWTIRTANV